MFNYIIRRLALLPITLFCIILVNFIIINLAPGEPVTVTEISQEGGASRKEDRSLAFGNDFRYLQFREHYGLTLPILFNTWIFLTEKDVKATLWKLEHHKESPDSTEEMSFKDYDDMRVKLGDQARFVMPILLKIIEDDKEDLAIRRMAVRFFVRGGTRQAFLGPNLTDFQKTENRKIAKDNDLLSSLLITPTDSDQEIDKKVEQLKKWYEENQDFYRFNPTVWQKAEIFFFETRFCRYMSKVLSLDFGTLRNDNNKTVIFEVARRFKYSLTLAVLPMLITFVLCQVFGFIMAYKQNQWPDFTFNVIFLILYAIPVFVEYNLTGLCCCPLFDRRGCLASQFSFFRYSHSHQWIYKS